MATRLRKGPPCSPRMPSRSAVGQLNADHCRLGNSIGRFSSARCSSCPRRGEPGTGRINSCRRSLEGHAPTSRARNGGEVGVQSISVIRHLMLIVSVDANEPICQPVKMRRGHLTLPTAQDRLRQIPPHAIVVDFPNCTKCDVLQSLYDAVVDPLRANDDRECFAERDGRRMRDGAARS